MDEHHAILVNEARYAERLCQRTARLYRRLQAFGVFATVIGGSAVLTALSQQVPAWVSLVGVTVMTAFAAALLAIRPADKAATNEADAKRYARLRTEAHRMDTAALREALNRCRESDTPEIESLRDVAFNDVVREVGRQDQAVPLRLRQRALAALA